MWDTVLFDLDGTVTDSGEGITKCVQYALKKGFKIDADLQDLRSFVGPPLQEQFMRYANLTSEEGKLAVELYRERYESIGIYENRLYPGIRTLLSQLKQEGFQIALSSSKPRLYCEKILKYFDIYRYFDIVEGAEMDGRRTDKAEVVHEAVRRLRMEEKKDRIVLVGDRKYDIIGANKEGISSIGVTYGYGSRKELEEVWPDCIVDSTEELRNVLIGQKRDGERQIRSSVAEQNFNNQMPMNRTAADFGQRESYQNGQESPYPYRNESPIRNQSVRRRYPYDGSLPFMIWKVVWPALLAYGINIALSFAFQFFLMFAEHISSANVLESEMIKYSLPMTGVMDAIFFVVMYQIWHRDEMQRMAWNADDRILKPNGFGLLQAIGCACLVLMVEFVLSVFSSLIPSSQEYSEFISSFQEFPAILSFLLVGILGPLGEEFLFRGVIFRRLRDFTNIWIAALLSGVTFGVFHGNLEQGIPAACIGFVMALLYEHYGTILAPLSAHIGVNCFSLLQDFSMQNGNVPRWFGTLTGLIFAAGIFAAVVIFRREERVNQV